jgi:hypothetical protein
VKGSQGPSAETEPDLYAGAARPDAARRTPPLRRFLQQGVFRSQRKYHIRVLPRIKKRLAEKRF